MLKRAGLTSVAAITLLTPLAACRSDRSLGPDKFPPYCCFSALIDGSPFNATFVSASFTSGTLSLGASDASWSLEMRWVDAGVGTYTIGSPNGPSASLWGGGPTWSASSSQGSGAITVTSGIAGGRVTGAFSFVLEADGATGATGTRTLTQGSFDVPF